MKTIVDEYKMLAKFMGYEYSNSNPADPKPFYHWVLKPKNDTNYLWNPAELWADIMEIVEKIISLGHKVSIIGDEMFMKCEIITYNNDSAKNNEFFNEGDDLVKVTYETVVEAINYLNSIKTK